MPFTKVAIGTTLPRTRSWQKFTCLRFRTSGRAHGPSGVPWMAVVPPTSARISPCRTASHARPAAVTAAFTSFTCVL